MRTSQLISLHFALCTAPAFSGSSAEHTLSSPPECHVTHALSARPACRLLDPSVLAAAGTIGTGGAHIVRIGAKLAARRGEHHVGRALLALRPHLRHVLGGALQAVLATHQQHALHARWVAQRLLLVAGAAVNTTDSKYPPLMTAAGIGHLESVRLLLRAEADPLYQVEGTEKVTALVVARDKGFTEIAELLQAAERGHYTSALQDEADALAEQLASTAIAVAVAPASDAGSPAAHTEAEP